MKANGTLILSTYPCWSITQSSKLQMARSYVALCQGKTARSLSCLTLTLFVYSMEYRKKNPPFAWRWMCRTCTARLSSLRCCTRVVCCTQMLTNVSTYL